MKYFRKFLRFLVSFLSVILIGYLRLYLNPILGDTSAYLVFIPAIIMSASYGGFEHGILAVLLSFFVVNQYIVTPESLFNYKDASEISGAISFFGIGAIVSWFIDTANISKNEIKKYFTAFEQADDGIFITDKRGRIQYVNDAFERMSGFKRTEILGKNPQIFKSEKINLKFYENLWKTIKSGKGFRGTFVNQRKNNGLFYADNSITPIKNSYGEVINFVGIWKDITKQSEIEKRKDEFMSIASHELKTPLTSIKAYIQIMGRKLKETKNHQLLNYTRRMNVQINNMTTLVLELLDVTRINAGKLSLTKKIFEVNSLLKETIKDAQITTDKKIIFGNGQKVINVFADRERISQVVSNLLSNAIKYSDKQKNIIVRSKKLNGSVQVSVQDYGFGIANFEKNKIFERFYRGKNINNSTPSFGIGLYISSKIIEEHNGKIGVDSEENRGSTFYFTLPLKN